MFRHYLTITLRNLLRNKFQTLFSIVGLAVGFFCFGICAYFVHGWLSMDKYYDNHDRVLQVVQSRGIHGIRSDFDFEAFRQQFPEVEAIFRFSTENGPYLLDERDSNLDLMVMECDTTLHHIYNPRLIAGSWEAAEQSPNSFLLTQSQAKRLFGDPVQAIGKTFDCMGGQRLTKAQQNSTSNSYTVQAVIEDLPYNNTLSTFTPISAFVMNDMNGQLVATNDYSFYYDPRILLSKGTDPETFIERLRKANYIEGNRRYANGEEETVYLDAQIPFDAERQFDNYAVFATILLIILLPGLLILLSALSNFFHLLLSNIMMRRREYTLRRVHGAHTQNLWLMVSTQVVITLLLVGVVTLIIVELCSPILNIRANSDINIMLDPNEMMLQAIEHIGAMLIVGLGIAWLAVARIRKDSLQESLKTSTGRRPGRHIGRNILMGWQMFIGFLFITLLVAFQLQLRVNERARLPWLTQEQKEEIIELPFHVGNGYMQTHEEIEAQTAKIAAISAELRAIPSVKEIQLCPANIGMFDLGGYGQEKTLNPQGDTIYSARIYTAEGMLEFIETPLLQGRWPENICEECVVDQAFSERNHIHVGDRITLLPELNGTKYFNQEGVEVLAVNVVGIIDNYAQKSKANNVGAGGYNMGAFYMYGNYITGHFAVKSYPGQAEAMRRALNQHFRHHEVFGNQEVDLDLPSLADEIYNSNYVERQLNSLFWLFAGIALIITLLGVYSAITMDTTARRKEMAIRKINGAKARHIIARFSRLYLILMTITAAIAFPLTYIFFHWFGNMGYREHFDYGPLFYLGIFLLMALFVALTVGVQIWKIASINPSKIVKSE